MSIYVLYATEAHQLLKLPYVFQHFTAHQQENSNITFLEFLAMHYMHGSPKDKDYKDDMKLPFKSGDNCFTSLFPAFFPATNTVFKTKPIGLVKHKIGIYEEGFILPAYLSNIWQPPKSC
ncbi:MAG: hypothetical protein JSS96_14680 [Bacteroidetes bacterium]|nr:hypothetical protein [Bacteroidota bacterium]